MFHFHHDFYLGMDYVKHMVMAISSVISSIVLFLDDLHVCAHGLRAPSVCNPLSYASGSTRHATTCGVIPPRCRTKLRVDSFTNRASLLWNAMPAAVRSSDFLQFKNFVLAPNAMQPYVPLLFDRVSDV